MQPESLNTIREKFLSFFESKGHLRLPSFSLVPQNDPSILLINAGMTPLKPYFTGAQKPPAPRVTTCQKCIRTPDIERVGQTSRHGTFFEMLGNFSFGDYFKEDVIPWAWEFCTDVLQIPEERMYISIYEEDDQAFTIWNEIVGIPAEKIYRLGKEDNFWEHGLGPCGPCSEIYYDRGPEKGCGRQDCQVGCDCDRYVEFWNLVFTQFNKEADGSYTPLEKKNIDTGAGLERLASILQDVDSLFEVDTIRSILDEVCRIAGKNYGLARKSDIAIRVITDHVRSTTMMISDGIIPSNEGRGYVLRRLLRRAARYGRLLGIDRPFLAGLAGIVIRESGAAYPELLTRQEYILKIIQIEEERFIDTIQQGLNILDSFFAQAREQNRRIIPGEEVFRLHDTYGFPLDLTREIAAENKMEIDEAGFHQEMDRQKSKARQALQEKGGSAWDKASLPPELSQRQSTLFSGYETLADKAEIIYILGSDADSDYKLMPDAVAGQIVQVITDKTPFYGASGGQAGDIGYIYGPDVEAEVIDTSRTPEGLVMHKTKIKSGRLFPAMTVKLKVEKMARLNTARNHTATHMLHQALKQVLGAHVAQAGSAVSAERLRFDFSHFQPLSEEEKQTVEDIVNKVILRDELVSVQEMSLEEARTAGAVALFDEKYGDRVRVVSVGDYSRELCGGTHLNRSSQACLFRIVSESAVAAGIRRIEAVTGTVAVEQAFYRERLLEASCDILKTQPQEIVQKIDTLQTRLRQAEKQLQNELAKQTSAAIDILADKTEKIGAFNILIAQVPANDAEQLRSAGDRLRDRLQPAAVVLAADIKGKAVWAVMLSSEVVKAGLHAGNMVSKIARITGGGGGGRPDMAQAGGKNPARIPQALQAARESIYQILTDGKEND